MTTASLAAELLPDARAALEDAWPALERDALGSVHLVHRLAWGWLWRPVVMRALMPLVARLVVELLVARQADLLRNLLTPAGLSPAQQHQSAEWVGLLASLPESLHPSVRKQLGGRG